MYFSDPTRPLTTEESRKELTIMTLSVMFGAEAIYCFLVKNHIEAFITANDVSGVYGFWNDKKKSHKQKSNWNNNE